MAHEETCITGAERAVAARIERLPISRWHIRVASVLGLATFFDGFDTLTIAFIMPVLVQLWKLTPVETGALIGIGYAGQAIGALAFAGVAQRWGRITAVRGAVAIIAVMSFVAAFAQDYQQLAAARLIQGIGLGGQVPIAATYISEIIGGRRRGRLFFFYQWSYGIGLICAALAGALIVPRMGWPAMFFIGASPVLLVFVLHRICPESPRWLASKGRMADADAVLTRIETEIQRREVLPPLDPVEEQAALPASPGRWRDLFARDYIRLTLPVCLLWAVSNGFLSGISAWLPTLLTRFYDLPLQRALNLSLITTLLSLGGLLILALVADRISRRILLASGFAAAAIATLTLMVIDNRDAGQVVWLIGAAMVALATVTPTLYVYTPELYPTRLRAYGIGFASFCLRISAIGAPIATGALLQNNGPRGLYATFGILLAISAVVALRWTIDTRRRLI